MAGWGEMATKLVKVLNQGSKNQVIKSLALNSEILDRIQNSFEKMIAVGDFFIHTFQEGRPIMKLGKVRTPSYGDEYYKTDSGSFASRSSKTTHPSYQAIPG
jgi:hypothetical protein